MKALHIPHWYVTHAAIARSATLQQLDALTLPSVGRPPRVMIVDRIEQACMTADELAIMTGRATDVVSALSGELAYTSYAHLDSVGGVCAH